MNLTENEEKLFLYKYLPFNQYSLQLIINHEFWLSSPNFLNDPFEGDFIINNYKELHNEKTIELLLNKYDKKEPLDKISYYRNYPKMLNDEAFFLNQLREYTSNSLKMEFGTTSFSNNCNSLKMWSHYADSHKGFILIFDRNKIAVENQPHHVQLIEVKYNSLARINLTINEDKIIISKDEDILRYKLPEWSDEEEIRIIRKFTFNPEYQRLFKFSIDSLLGVIYGEQMSHEHFRTINGLLKRDGKYLEAYITKKNLERNKLIFEQINESNIQHK